MATFFTGGSQNLNDLANKKPIKKFNINPLFVRSNYDKEKYEMYFQNMCFDGTPYLGILNVDQSVLKNKLETWIKPKDRKYVHLDEFTNTKSKFVFNIKEWMDDGFKSVKPYTDYVTFTRTYRLANPLPVCVSVYGTSMIYEKQIAEYFKKYLKENAKLRKDVYGMIENITSKTLNTSHLSMFDYKYNNVENSISITLKPQFVGGVLAALKVMVDKQSALKKVNFDKTVKKYLNI